MCDDGPFEFALTLPTDKASEVLRRVANVIEKIEHFDLLSLVVTTLCGEATASVSYALLEKDTSSA